LSRAFFKGEEWTFEYSSRGWCFAGRRLLYIT
jgi:hypothetical protein